MEEYEQKANFQLKLRAKMLARYDKHWEFLGYLTCTQKEALSAYKNNSSIINAILWLPLESQPLKDTFSLQLYSHQVPLTYVTPFLEEYVGKQLRFIEGIESVFSTAPKTSKPMYVYRGIGADFVKVYADLKKGEKLVLKSFLSTTFNFELAIRFAERFYQTGTGAIVRLELPKKTPYVLLPGSAAESYKDISKEKLLADLRFSFDELELLLDKNTILQLVSVTKIPIAPSEDMKTVGFKEIKTFPVYNMKYVGHEDVKFTKSTSDVLKEVKEIQVPLWRQ